MSTKALLLAALFAICGCKPEKPTTKGSILTAGGNPAEGLIRSNVVIQPKKTFAIGVFSVSGTNLEPFSLPMIRGKWTTAMIVRHANGFEIISGSTWDENGGKATWGINTNYTGDVAVLITAE